jgi:hydroxylamine reductase
MYCYQCEQTRNGQACTTTGVCGKDEPTAELQDLLFYSAIGVAQYASAARQLGARDVQVDHYVLDALFTTVTNVNFDADQVFALVCAANPLRDRARQLYEDAAKRAGKTPASFSGPAAARADCTLQACVTEARLLGIEKRLQALGPDLTALQELLAYGLKGLAAYAHHAMRLGYEKDDIYGDIHHALALLAKPQPAVDELLGACLKAGEINLRVMELLDTAHTTTFGHPEPTKVRVTPVAGKCILVSGHDLEDLARLLEATAGKGINIYTHGEMLPAHGYPGLKKHKHLVGHYGGAWQKQAKEFSQFPGAILMTTNCIQQPRSEYRDRLFTTGLVYWPGVTHVANGDFAQVIAAAQAAPGFTATEAPSTIMVGFGHHATLSAAEQVVAAVKSGAVRHFFLVGGCDGAKPGRNYYTEFCQQVPQDCIILTLACGKFRFNHLDFGQIGGIPRLLDLGQCNDAYSAIKIAGALAGAFNCGVNDLPLTLVLSWYEQKAVAILLTLLHLGIKNIRLGPTLPAFVTPAILDVLVKQFQLAPITTPEADLAVMLAK